MVILRGKTLPKEVPEKFWLPIQLTPPCFPEIGLEGGGLLRTGVYICMHDMGFLGAHDFLPYLQFLQHS